MAATIRLAFFVSFLSRVLSQAPGDGDSFCVDAIINGVPNVFFTNITYPADERPLMDSRDYVTLLQGDNPKWQQVDNDNNNDHEISTHVRYSVLLDEPYVYLLQMYMQATNNTQEAAVALLPLTMHPQSWAEPHIHVHTGKCLPSVPPSPEEHLFALNSS